MATRTAGQWPRLGRQRQDVQDARERARYIKFLRYVLMGLMTLSEASRALDVGLSTLDRRRRELIGDDAEDTDDLRKLTQARRHWRRDNGN